MSEKKRTRLTRLLPVLYNLQLQDTLYEKTYLKATTQSFSKDEACMLWKCD
jgi:hypothetical protein